ncbi:hypothetical protein RJ639_037420 [Escallonia herrerae]|uniref:Pentatricopeptide repeat-containing protein n=1 Tax=Escallonia herrerae TaxID=1293975 RepID=A0AA89BHK2_9ASTE|nr:hypothetical protein RJ639_037420 [Escallonia herrerae]
MRCTRIHGSCLRSLQTKGSSNLQRVNHSRPRKATAGKQPDAMTFSLTESDIVKWNVAITNHMRNGQCESAMRLFNSMPPYVHNGRIEDAQRLFESKADWDVVSWNCLMGGYLKKRRLVDARQVFDRMPLRDEVSWNTMISGYAQISELSEAKRLFVESPVKDVDADIVGAKPDLLPDIESGRNALNLSMVHVVPLQHIGET